MRGLARSRTSWQGEGEGAKPTKSLVRKLAARAGEEGQNLGQVLDEDPALEHTLATAAARNPQKALDSVQEIIDKNDALNTPVYKAITDAGGIKLTDVVSPMQKLRQGYIEAGKTAEAEAVEREIASLVKNYGGKEAEKAVLTGKQMRGHSESDRPRLPSITGWRRGALKSHR